MTIFEKTITIILSILLGYSTSWISSSWTTGLIVGLLLFNAQILMALTKENL